MPRSTHFLTLAPAAPHGAPRPGSGDSVVNLAREHTPAPPTSGPPAHEPPDAGPGQGRPSDDMGPPAGPPLGQPFNWCDSLCKRCPLADGCGAYQLQREHEQRMDRRDDEPTMASVIEEVTRMLTEVVESLGEAMAAEGLDPDALAPSRDRKVVSLFRQRLRRRSQAFGVTVARIIETLESAPDRPIEPSTADRAMGYMVLLHGKVGRVLTYVSPSGEPEEPGAWRSDAAPNLALIQRVLGDIRRAIRPHLAHLPDDLRARWTTTDAQLNEALAPLFDAVPRQTYREIQTLVERHEAPSPFCTVSER